jgi:hypothetical protein
MVLVDWPRLLSTADGYETRPGVTEDELAAHAPLPSQLRKLYLVSDGVFNRPGQWFVIWPLAELAGRNDPGRPELLAFGDDGTGGQFCVLRDDAPGVFLWDPFLAAPRWLANDLGDFWLGWTTGTITTFDQAA